MPWICESLTLNGIYERVYQSFTHSFRTRYAEHKTTGMRKWVVGQLFGLIVPRFAERHLAE